MIIFLILITNVTFISQDHNAITTNSVPEKWHPVIELKAALTPHDPIIIGNDSGFDSYGFPGDGSSSQPYIITGFSINNSAITDGIVIENTTQHFKIINCYIEVNGTGIHVMNIASGTAIITNNQLKDCVSNGIFLLSADNTIVANNTGLNGHIGLRIYDSTGIYAYNNSFIGSSPSGYYCFAGFDTHSSSNLILINNTIDGFDRGFSTRETSFSLIANNTILSSQDYSGIFLGAFSDYNLIINNTISNNSLYWGIRIYNSMFNEISYNTIKDNFQHGCYLDYGVYHNYIHHNNFIENNNGMNQSYAASDSNIWYQTNIKEGNYWSDWDGSNPYKIDGSNSYDLYPLHSPAVMDWTDFQFSLSNDDIYEDNDCLDDALDIPFNKTLNLIYNDVDFFRFTINEMSNVTATIEFVNYIIDLDLFLLLVPFPGSPYEILARSEGTSSQEIINFVELPPGVYYLLVKCPTTFYLHEYTLKITFINKTIIISLPSFLWVLATFITITCVTSVIIRKQKNCTSSN